MTQSQTYINSYNTYKDLYENESVFREGCLEISKQVLEDKCGFGAFSQESFCIAVKYFLAELPLFLNSPEILNLKSSLFVYKDTPKFISKMYNDSLVNHLPSKFQGYMAIKFA